MHIIELKAKLLEVLGYFWLRLFNNETFVDAYTDALAVNFDFLETLVNELPEYQSRYTIPLKEIKNVYIFVFDENDLDTNAYHYGDGSLYGGTAIYGKTLTALSEYVYPIATDLIPPYLSVSVLGDELVLQSGVDYEISEGKITFKNDPLTLANVVKRPLVNEDGELKYQFMLWSFQTEYDVYALRDFFGAVAGVCGESTQQYKDAVNLAWDLRVDGASKENILRVLSLAAGVDFVDQAGTVIDIYMEGDKVCVRTETAVYTAPININVLVSIGTSIEIGEIIFDAYSIRFGKEDVDFNDFGGLSLDDDFLERTYKETLFISNSQVDLTKRHAPDWSYVQHD